MEEGGWVLKRSWMKHYAIEIWKTGVRVPKLKLTLSEMKKPSGIYAGRSSSLGAGPKPVPRDDFLERKLNREPVALMQKGAPVDRPSLYKIAHAARGSVASA